MEKNLPSPLAGEGGARSATDEGYSAPEQSAPRARTNQLREATKNSLDDLDAALREIVEATATIAHAAGGAMRAAQRVRAEAQSFLLDTEQGDVKLSEIVAGRLQEPMMAVLLDGTAVCMGGRWRGWLFRKHPDGHWVSAMKLAEEFPL